MTRLLRREAPQSSGEALGPRVEYRRRPHRGEPARLAAPKHGDLTRSGPQRHGRDARAINMCFLDPLEARTRLTSGPTLASLRSPRDRLGLAHDASLAERAFRGDRWGMLCGALRDAGDSGGPANAAGLDARPRRGPSP